jgi:hypothetical protein
MFRDGALYALARASDAPQFGGSFPGLGRNRVVSIVPVLSWLAAFAGAAIALARSRRPLARAFVLDRLLRYIFIFPVGSMGLWAALGHIVFPTRVAQAIGWPTSPFQFEVGVANLGIGLAGLYAAFHSFEARLATNLAVASFLIGAGVRHIRDIMAPVISHRGMPARSYSPTSSPRRRFLCCYG